jgi:hypothetical protein
MKSTENSLREGEAVEENGAKATQRISRAIALSLSEALGMMEPIHRQGGGNEVPTSALESIVGNSPTSSTFHSKIAALKTYGLIETHGKKIISLSPLGKAYATPVSPEDKKQTAIQAFRKVPLFENLLIRYSGNPLPEIDQFFYNLLYSTYAVPIEEAPKWMKRFVEGARLVGLLVSEGGHEVVRLPGSAGAPSPKPQGGAPKMEIEETRLTGEMVDVRIFGGGLSINLPDKINADDLQESIDATEMLLKMLEAKLKKLKRETGDETH